MKKKLLIIAFVLVLVMLLVASIFIYKSKRVRILDNKDNSSLLFLE